jgi:hypothetical protein
MLQPNLVDNGFPGENITIIDMGKDPYRRPYSEVMTGFLVLVVGVMVN